MQSPLLDCHEAPSEEREATEEKSYHYVFSVEKYLTAAFRSSKENEVHLFIANEHVLLNYAPGNDKVLSGPTILCKRFPSLEISSFCEWGVDTAFGSHHGNEAYIFSGNSCVHLEYGTDDVKILREACRFIMFPGLNGTPFKTAMDAAFESSTINEAYILLGNKYCILNYQDGRVITISTFDCLKNTIFESQIDAAFASHKTGEAYLFKGDSYTIINYTNDCIIGGVKKMFPVDRPSDWPSLKGILPRKTSCWVEDHDHHRDTSGFGWWPTDEENSDEDLETGENSDEDLESNDYSDEDFETDDENTDEDVAGSMRSVPHVCNPWQSLEEYMIATNGAQG